MATILYTGGKNPFGDGYVDPSDAIGHFRDRIRAQRPGITDTGVSILVKRALGLLKPRMDGRIVPVLGRDIMSERVESEPFWNLLGPRQRQIILAHPIHGGQVITADMDAVSRSRLMTDENRAAINRMVLVTRRGERQLSRTYVWSKATDWEQEVDDADWELLLEYRSIGQLLLRIDTGAQWKPVVAYSHIPVLERHEARDLQDVDSLRRQFTRTHHHQGVDV